MVYSYFALHQKVSKGEGEGEMDREREQKRARESKREQESEGEKENTTVTEREGRRRQKRLKERYGGIQRKVWGEGGEGRGGGERYKENESDRVRERE